MIMEGVLYKAIAINSENSRSLGGKLTSNTKQLYMGNFEMVAVKDLHGHFFIETVDVLYKSIPINSE